MVLGQRPKSVYRVYEACGVYRVYRLYRFHRVGGVYRVYRLIGYQDL